MARVNMKYVTTPSTLTDGEFAVGLCDANGRAQVAEQFAAQAEDNTNGVLQVVLKPLTSATYSPSLNSNLGANATQNVKASAGSLLSVYAHNLNAAARYLQFHNTATTPSGGAVPVLTFLLPGSGSLLIGREFFSHSGLRFATGIALAFSTTEGTYTAATAAECFSHVTYI